MADKDPKEILKETLETVEILKDSFNSLGAIIKNTIADIKRGITVPFLMLKPIIIWNATK